MRDQLNNLHVLNVIPPIAARTDNTAIVSTIVDTRGYDSATFAIAIGTNTDTNATFAVTMDHGDASDLSDATSVPTGSLVGTLALAGFTAASDDTKSRKIGYVGSKRYVRLTITPSGNDSGNIFVAAVAILGNPQQRPTPNPPV
jgi:hypothetical protein